MKKTIIRLILTLLAILVVMFLIGRRLDWFNRSSMNENISNHQRNALPVNGIIAQYEELDSKIIATGTVLPDESVDLSCETSGKITGLYFNEGARVKKGDLLLTINDADLQAQLQRLKYQETLLEEVEYRQRMLLEREAVSREVYEKALTDLNTNRAEIKNLQAQIAKTRIYAPFDGTIGLRYVSEGSYITPNVRIATLTKLQPVKIEFTIPERYASEVRIGNKITFTTDNTDQMMEASVYAVEPIIDQATRTMKLRAMYPNRNLEVLPGSFATIELILKTYPNAVSVPTETVVPELGSLKVFVYRSGNAEPVIVNAGIRTSNRIQILNGLHPGDTVITTGMLQLRKGMPVDIQIVEKIPESGEKN
jgi:membrane fusion protein, multidrug efflux system